MGGAAVDLELLGHRPAEPALRQHPLHRPLDDALRMGLQHGLRSHFTEAPDVPRVPAIHLVAKLPSREMDLLGVHDHDVVAHVEVRREGRLVFPTEDRRDTTGEATEDLTVGIEDEPLPLDLILLRHRRRHRVPSTVVALRRF